MTPSCPLNLATEMGCYSLYGAGILAGFLLPLLINTWYLSLIHI
jgi:hypothetical protein